MDKTEKQKETQKRFDSVFQNEKEYYERQTKDDEHLRLIINSLTLSENSKVIDLGTGTGYIAFEIAERYKNIEVIGVDILEETSQENNKKAMSKHVENIEFIKYDGIKLPFMDSSIDCVVSRYALHHFVDIQGSFFEIARVLKPGGQLFISDPTPNEEDEERFVDVFMKLCEDGHVMFYKRQELEELALRINMKIDGYFITEIRFPSGSRTEGYKKIEHGISEKLKNDYNIKIISDEVWITEKVLNISFKKE
jgi:ubiquinone/menaquinone biosynthesis C-methylase UbiE